MKIQDKTAYAVFLYEHRLTIAHNRGIINLLNKGVTKQYVDMQTKNKDKSSINNCKYKGNRPKGDVVKMTVETTPDKPKDIRVKPTFGETYGLGNISLGPLLTREERINKETEKLLKVWGANKDMYN